MSGLLRFSKVPEGPASRLWGMPRTPFALMQQCPGAWKEVGMKRWHVLDFD